MAEPVTTRTVDDVLRDYEVIFSGRTRYAGQEPRDDELLVAEIKRLRVALGEQQEKGPREAGQVFEVPSGKSST